MSLKKTKIVRLFALAMLFFPVASFAQNAASDPQALRRVQVGAFRDPAEAQVAFDMLLDAGLSPVRESHEGFVRVALPGIAARDVPSVVGLANRAGFPETWVRPEDENALYTVQAGAFLDARNADAAFGALRSAGLSPARESSGNFTRIVMLDVRARDLAPLLGTIYGAGFRDVWLRAPGGSAALSGQRFNITNLGGAAVSEIVRSNSRTPLAIVQTVPSFGAGATDRTYSANAPVMFFFNDKIYLNSIAGNIEVTANGQPIGGNIVVNEGANGFAILSFTPAGELSPGMEVSIVVKKEIQSANGNPMLADVRLSFVTEQGSQTEFVGNYGFELGEVGVVFTGDGAVREAIGPLEPYEGLRYAAISTGNRLLSGASAINGRTSQIIVGPIPQAFSRLSFWYDFISSEFNDYIGSKFDDTATVTVLGPRGSHTEIITSVNIVGLDNMPFVGFPRIPDAGDRYAGHTGWLNFTLEDLDVGSPAYIIFTVTDVGDDVLSSILAIDEIELGASRPFD